MAPTPNPLLKKLGYSDNDRLVIIHTDDIGMCQASVDAFRDLWEFGTISSGAVMVPCPWFPAVARLCRERPEIDMGIHATLNAEWENYRWAPISTRDPNSGLLDADGYFHQWHPAVYDQAQFDAVATELNAQLTRALAAGIDVTHIDSHMGTIMHPKFVQTYLQAGAANLLPNMLPRPTAPGFWMMENNEEARTVYLPILRQLEEQGLPMLDGLSFMPLNQPDGQLELAKNLLGNLPVGITHFIMHPSTDTPELRALAPDWESRVENYKTFMSDELKTFIEAEDIHVIGYRPIRDALRNS